MNIYYTCRINTNSYAGNFEREMAAYITGQVGDCGVGIENAEIAEKELLQDTFEWFERNLQNFPDEHGCFRPVTITKNSKLSEANNNSIEIRFDLKPPDFIQDTIQDRAYKFQDNENLHRWTKELKVISIEFFEVITQTTINKI